MTRGLVLLTAVLAAGGLAGCGPSRSGQDTGEVPEGTTTPPAPTGPATTAAVPTPSAAAAINLVDEGYTGRFRAWATVLEKGDGGPQLCLGGVATSYPPQCGGPPITGWSWAKVAHEHANDVRWGSYVVVGRYDGTRFTLTEPPRVDDGSGPRPDLPPVRDYTSPCPAPPGGWLPPDPARATDDAEQQAVALAAQQPGYAALWIDQNLGTASPGPSGPDNDPTRIVLNVSTTGDLAATERTLRTVWGGNLCVSRGVRTEAELNRVQTALQHAPGMLGSGADAIGGWVDLSVVRATRQYQRELDDTYGPGLVRLIGALHPLD